MNRLFANSVKVIWTFERWELERVLFPVNPVFVLMIRCEEPFDVHRCQLAWKSQVTRNVIAFAFKFQNAKFLKNRLKYKGSCVLLSIVLMHQSVVAPIWVHFWCAKIVQKSIFSIHLKHFKNEFGRKIDAKWLETSRRMRCERRIRQKKVLKENERKDWGIGDGKRWKKRTMRKNRWLYWVLHD